MLIKWQSGEVTKILAERGLSEFRATSPKDCPE